MSLLPFFPTLRARCVSVHVRLTDSLSLPSHFHRHLRRSQTVYHPPTTAPYVLSKFCSTIASCRARAERFRKRGTLRSHYFTGSKSTTRQARDWIEQADDEVINATLVRNIDTSYCALLSMGTQPLHQPILKKERKPTPSTKRVPTT